MNSYISLMFGAEGAKERLQRGAVSVEASIWIASYLLAILGLVKAAYSEQPLLWLAVWPAPVALASTIFIFSVRDSISEMGCWSSAGAAPSRLCYQIR